MNGQSTITTNHFETVVGAIEDGGVIPFFGAGVNVFGRKERKQYKPGKYLPSGGELSRYLAKKYRYPAADKNDLLRVSQYVSLTLGQLPLYTALGKVFDSDYPITKLHRFFAKLPGILRSKKHQCPYQLIVTTNYDDVLERAFREENEPFDLVTYIAKKTNQGMFRHVPHGTQLKDSILIRSPNEYRDLPFRGLAPQRTVILKIHGIVERNGNRSDALPEDLHDSFVITEDDYIDYVANADISQQFPVQLKSKLKNSGFLFLGYGLRDWNLRVIMHRIWRERDLSSNSWAIQLKVNELDRKFWEPHKVEILDSPLEVYIEKLEKKLLGQPL